MRNMQNDIMRDVLEKHRSEVARLIFKEFDEAEFLELQRKETEDLKEEIRLAKEQIKQTERQAKEHIEQTEEENKRLRKILEAHGWSE